MGSNVLEAILLSDEIVTRWMLHEFSGIISKNILSINRHKKILSLCTLCKKQELVLRIHKLREDNTFIVQNIELSVRT